MRTEEPQKIYLTDYQPPTHLIDTIDLRFQLHPTDTIVRARLKLRQNPAAAPASNLVLHGEDLVLKEVRIDGAQLGQDRYEVTDKTLTIASPPGAFELEITTRISPTTNTRLEGLYQSDGLFCTQCEAHGFRRITYYLDRPDVLSVFTTRIEADKADVPILLSNGNEIENGDLGDGRHYAVWHDPHPKPAYLFALAAGRLAVTQDHFKTRSGRDVRLRIFVDPGNEDQTDFAMGALKRSMAWDEQTFGREYDLDDFMIVAVRAFNFGAMENKGLNIFNSSVLLASPETTTDDEFGHIEGIVAHEYFHNWTGNRITCRDWFQLCLKEGLTVFRDQLFSADMRGEAVCRISNVKRLRNRQFPEDDGPLAHPPRPDSFIEIDNFYTATVYEKGAEICRILQTVLGKETFRKGMDHYFERFDGQAITVEAFIDALSEGSGRDLNQFMTWYTQAGRPNVSVESTYDESQKTVTLKLSQTSATPIDEGDYRPVPIPFRFGLLDKTGKECALEMAPEGASAHGALVLLTDLEQTFTFNVSAAPIARSYLRGLSAPVTLRYAGDIEEDLFLFAHDTDQFNRWDAGQRAITSAIHTAAKAHLDKQAFAFPPTLAKAIERTLLSPALEPAYKGLALGLPTVAELGQSHFMTHPNEPVDYVSLQTGRQALLDWIGTAIKSNWRQTYETLTPQITDSTDIVAAGNRALRNRCLAYLSNADAAGPKLIETHYMGARCMTDRLTALTIAVHDAHECADTLLRDFAERFWDAPIVMDKWFRTQATSPAANTLARVRTLQSHELFDMKNPDRVRALIGAYTNTNVYRFHADGADGYQFLADKVLELDKTNPKLAARLLTELSSWARLPKDRQEDAKAALSRILETKGLSPNVFEIVSKSLKA